MSPPPAGERISTRRKWTAVGAGTLLVTGSYWAVLLAFRAWLGDLGDEELEAGVEVAPSTGVVLGLVGAFALMVAGFAALALISRRYRPLWSIALAAALGGLMWLSLPYLLGEPVTPMVAGFSAGGVVTLAPSRSTRWAAGCSPPSWSPATCSCSCGSPGSWGC